MNQSTIIKDPIFTKSFNINFAINFFVYLCMYLLIVVIASYSKSEYHASDSVAGLVVGLFIVGSLIGRFVTGKYVNRFGPKNSHFGLICLVVTQLLYFYTWFCLVLNDGAFTERLSNSGCYNCYRNNSSIYYTTYTQK